MERIKEMEQLLKEQKKPVPDPKRVAACKERMMEEISHQVILPSRPRFSADVGECGVYFQVDLGRASLFLCGGCSDGAS